MAEQFDAIVVGLGAMGAAAAHHLSRRGLSVLGLEQFEPGHAMGSSHGRSRVIRKAYFEDPRYVPLLHRAYELWRELERESGEQLLHLPGCLNLGPRDHACIRGVLESVNRHGLRHEVLDAAEVSRRWPAFEPAAEDVGVFEADGGYVIPERCVLLQSQLAQRQGAVLRYRDRVSRWEASPGQVSVSTETSNYRASALVLTAGPWLPGLLSALGLPLRIERQIQLWFQPTSVLGMPEAKLPSFIHFVGKRAYYGIPMRDPHGMKIARHHDGVTTTPETVDRGLTPEDERDVRDYIRSHMPSLNGPLLSSEVCLYTNTPDDHFIIDRHPGHENVIVAGGFSGHGFKFSPVVGSILADLATEGRTTCPIDFFRIDRFGA